MDWPLFELTLSFRGVRLRAAREADLSRLADLLPDDYDLDPRIPPLPGLTPAQDRRRVFHLSYWQALATWTPDSWVLPMVVEHDGVPVGMQTLQAGDFPRLRTVDSASWLIPEVRGRGLGVAMRAAVLGLAFDRLGAVAAVSSATVDNAASLGVSRRLGYADNGVSLVARPGGAVVELRHLRLKIWKYPGQVRIDHFGPCAPYFSVPAA